VWTLLRHSPDPSRRSYLVWRLAGIGLDPLTLIRRYEAEPDVSARRALLLALGEYDPARVPAAERAALAGRLLTRYRDDPDPGLHSAIDWLLRQRWGRGEELARLDTELAARVPGAPPAGRGWYVNGEGQTYAVVRGPVAFAMGSPVTEPGRVEGFEPPHRKVIPRTFAVATREVTTAQFLRFRPDHKWEKRYSPDPNGTAVAVTWYDAAAYCNWLSEREGIRKDQWCYEPNPDGKYAEGMRASPGHLGLTGYRLPTEAEWEYACRAEAATARYFGRAQELLPRYAWFVMNAEDRAWPGGQLRPNDLGLFDALGNAYEWAADPAVPYDTSQAEDRESAGHLTIDDRQNRVLRGGSFIFSPAYVRSARRVDVRPGYRLDAFGFRPVRTLPPSG
jgi:formylglycine-generating enzyme required for sulfatase activity